MREKSFVGEGKGRPNTTHQFINKLKVSTQYKVKQNWGETPSMLHSILSRFSHSNEPHSLLLPINRKIKNVTCFPLSPTSFSSTWSNALPFTLKNILILFTAMAWTLSNLCK